MKVEVEAGDVFDEFNFKQRGLKVGLQKDDICIPNQHNLFTSKNRQKSSDFSGQSVLLF